MLFIAKCHPRPGVRVPGPIGGACRCGDGAVFGVDGTGCFAGSVIVPSADTWPVPDPMPGLTSPPTGLRLTEKLRNISNQGDMS